LSFSSIDSRKHDIKLAYEGTCDWLFHTSEFQQWINRENLASHNGVLWIKGKAGAGKSTLMKHVLSHCQSLPNQFIITYFFNARGDVLERTPLGMFRSLVLQMLESNPLSLERFLPLYIEHRQRHGDNDLNWPLGQLRDFILLEINHPQPQGLLFLIDALDECNESEVRMVASFLERLSLKAVASTNSLNICLSSRHYPSISMKSTLELNIDTIAGHKRDIVTYVRDNLRIMDEDIQNELLRKAEGVFLWTILVVEMLNTAYDEGDADTTQLQRKLETIPSELDEMFLGLFKPGKENSKTVLLFQWLLFAKRPLAPEELYFALIAGNGSDDIRVWDRQKLSRNTMKRSFHTLSKGLVEIRSGSLIEIRTGQEDNDHEFGPTVQFIHDTVREFFLKTGRLQMMDPTLEPDSSAASHDRLRACCISYIFAPGLKMMQLSKKYDGDFDNHKLAQEYPFVRYASHFALYHAEEAQARGFSQHDFVQQLHCDPEIFGYLTPLHDVFLNNVNKRFGLNTEPLRAVVLEGYMNLTKQLLDTGADVNAQGGSYGTALQAAVITGNSVIVKQLLERGSDVNAQGIGYIYTQGLHCVNALQSAIAVGNDNIVKQLLEAGAEVNAQGGFYGNALQAAAASGNHIIVRELINAGAKVNAQEGYYGNALQAAAANDHSAVVKQLLEVGADVNARGGIHGDALRAAKMFGRETIIKQLLEAGADFNAQGNGYDGVSPTAAVDFNLRKGKYGKSLTAR
jgi:ankyrin repeat protein